MQTIENPKGWYIAARSKEVQGEPIRKQFLDSAVVLFRSRLGKIIAFEDRCPHRGVPLSQGKPTELGIQCAYHGWEFNSAGECIRIPGLETCEPVTTRNVQKYSAVEQQGFIWIQNGFEYESVYSIPYLTDKRYMTIYYRSELTTTLFDALENALDVPHTAILHQGLFR